MNIEWINEFTLIAKHGNLSQASRELNIAQSALSRHLSVIEEELGGELYDRSSNPMKLTRMGEMFLRESNIIAAQYYRIKELAAKMRKESAATITVGGSLTPITGMLLRSVRTSEQTPYHLKFDNLSTQTPFHLVREGGADIVVEPLSEFVDIHGLVHEHLYCEAMYIVVQRSHELASRSSIEASALVDLDFIALLGNGEHAVRKHLQEVCGAFSDRGSMPRRLYASPTSSTYDELFFNGLEDAAVALPKSIALRYAADVSMDYVAIPVADEGTAYDFHVFSAEGAPKKTVEFVKLLVGAAEEMGVR